MNPGYELKPWIVDGHRQFAPSPKLQCINETNLHLRARIKISIFTDISLLGFCGYIRDILIFINYSKFKYIFNLYIKISLKVYEMKTFHFLSYHLSFLQFFIIINDSNY